MMTWAQRRISISRSRSFAFSAFCALGLTLVCNSSLAHGLERFHFDYAIYGMGQPQNLQIFDDGIRTFLLWDESVDAPRIEDGNSKDALALNREGTYWVIQGVHSHLLLRFGRGYFHVLATAGSELSPLTIAQVKLDLKAHTPYQLKVSEDSLTQSPLALVSNSYAQPTRGDELSWINGEEHQGFASNMRTEHSSQGKLTKELESSTLVPFAKGSKVLEIKAKQRMREFLKGLGGEFELTVVGYEDDSYVEDLGRDRAYAILQFLLTLGVRQERVKLEMEPFTELRAKNSNSVTTTQAKINWRPHVVQGFGEEKNNIGGFKLKPHQDPPFDGVSPPMPLGQIKSATSSTVEPIVKASQPRAVINQGELIHEGLERFAKSRNWTLMWLVNWDWKAVAEVDLSKGADPVDAVSKVIEALKQEGHPLQLRVYEDNQVMEVVTTEVFND